jgi:glycosyltransferase involved in cell wall biosynthesis
MKKQQQNRWLRNSLATVLYEEVLAKVEEIGHADILVGVPSFCNASTITHVVKNACLGMVRYFPDLKPVLVNSDGGSVDQTPDLVLRAQVPHGVEKIVTFYQGPAGKGSAIQTILEIANRLNVKICLVVDSDLRSITPEWIRLLADPIYRHNFGFVAPYYKRYKYDGTITNNLAYPLTRALYGQIIRQPIGGDFGICWALAKIFAHKNILNTKYIHKFGVDVWMTTTAINEGFRICQADIGVKLHDKKDPSTDLSSMFKEVVGTMFTLMRDYEAKWKVVRGSQPVDLFGVPSDVQPESFTVEPHLLLTKFKEGLGHYKSIIRQILSEENFRKIQQLTLSPQSVFEFEDKLWARVVYDFAVAYNWSLLDPEIIIEALKPLYLGRTASFILSTEVMDNIEAERLVEKTAATFEEEKTYLIERWDIAKTTPNRKPHSTLANLRTVKLQSFSH